MKALTLLLVATLLTSCGALPKMYKRAKWRIQSMHVEEGYPYDGQEKPMYINVHTITK